MIAAVRFFYLYSFYFYLPKARCQFLQALL